MEGCLAEEGQGSLGRLHRSGKAAGPGVQHQPEAMGRGQLGGRLQAGAEPQAPLHADPSVQSQGGCLGRVRGLESAPRVREMVGEHAEPILREVSCSRSCMEMDHGLDLESRLPSVQLVLIEHPLYAQPWGRAVLRVAPGLRHPIAGWGAESKRHGPSQVNCNCHG